MTYDIRGRSVDHSMTMSQLKCNRSLLSLAGYYLLCNFVATACGTVVSACVGDRGSTPCRIIGGQPAAMGMGSIVRLAAGKGAGIMGTTAYW
jgi:hypothetical protein